MEQTNEPQFNCIENTLDIQTLNLRIRLWINKDSPGDHYQSEMRIARDVIYYVRSQKNFDRNLFFSWISTVPGLNAAQVIYTTELIDYHEGGIPSKARFGTVVYTVPFTDVHG